MKAGLGHQIYITSFQPGQKRLKQGRDPGRFRAAHIENFNGAFPEDAPVMPVQPHRIDGRHLFGLSQPGQAEGILPAHGLQQAAHGIGPLVIHLGFDGGDEIFLLALHEGGQESALFCGGFQQQLRDKFHHGLQHPVPRQGKPVIHEAAVKAGGLVVAHPADHRADGCAVELVQPVGDGPQIAVFFCAPQQHRGQQGIHGVFIRRHGPDDLETETALLEPGIPAAPQGDAFRKLIGLDHRFSLCR